MKTSGRVTPAARAAAACSMASPAVMPLLRARHPARWMLGPSARGSLNGIPISAAAHPASWAARSTSTVSSRRGKPAVTYGTRAGSPPSPPPCNSAMSRSPGGIGALAVVLADGADVLVATARQTHHDDRGWGALGGEHLGDVEGVARLQGGDDPLEAAEPVERRHGLVVVGAQVAHPAAVMQGAVLRAHARVVEAGADRVGSEHLAVLVLHEVAVRAVEHSGPSAVQRRRVFGAVEATAGSLDADQLDTSVIEECGEHADRVAAAADAGNHGAGKGSPPLQAVGARLVADDALQDAHQRRVGVRTDAAADHVMSVADVGDPVADRLVGGVLERAGAAVDGDDRGTQEAHAIDVDRLAAHVLTADVHRAAEAGSSACRGGGHAMLAGAGLRDNPALAHALGEHHLAEGVVDLVGAGVEQVLALQPDLRPTGGGAQSWSVGEGCGAARVLVEQPAPFRLERRVGEGLVHDGLELVERRHHGLGDIGSAIGAEATAAAAHARAPSCREASAARAAST